MTLNLILTGSTTALDESQNDKNRRPWKELPPPKLSAMQDKNTAVNKKISALTSKSTPLLWNSDEKPAWVPTMKQPSKKQKKISVKRLKPTDMTSPEKNESNSSNIIYIDGTPYIRLESTSDSENLKQNKIQIQIPHIDGTRTTTEFSEIPQSGPRSPDSVVVESKGELYFY